MNLKELIDPIANLAADAGQAILEVYATDFDVQSKDDESPLTQADLASHHCIVAGLEALTPDMRELFDLFAPLTELEPVDDSELVRTWVARLLEAAHRTDPLTEPVPLLGDLRQPVHLLHGRTDRLIPFTESLRLGEHLAKLGDAHTTVTRLFAHSSEDEFPRGWAGLREGGRFVTALARILAIV